MSASKQLSTDSRSLSSESGGDKKDSTPSSQDYEGHTETGFLNDLLGLSTPSQRVQKPWTGKRSWFRATLTQATILGMCSFLAPGIWGAMAALGAGGAQSPHVVNAANSLTFGLMVVTSFFNSALVNLTSIKFALIFGTIGYAPYAAGLYLNSKNGASWLIILGAGLCGISAGVFWSAEGSIILAYPERNKQARYISYWLMFRVLGQILGGAVNLALNVDRDEQGSISTNTYLVFVALQACGPFVAMLLSPPHKVQRKDRSPVYLNIESSTKKEIKSMLKLLASPNVLLLLPMIWQTTWSEALIGTYATNYFTVRSRALGSLLSAICASIANYLIGFFLDWKKPSMNLRGKWAFIVVYALQGGYWIWAIYIMNEFHNAATKPVLDWTSDGYGRAFALYIMLQVGFNMMYNLTYWIVGSINDDPAEIVRLASIVRGIESAGQCVSYGVNSTRFRLDAVAGINMAQWAICLLPAWIVVRKIGITKDGVYIHEPAIYAPEEERKKLEEQGVHGAVADGGRGGH